MNTRFSVVHEGELESASEGGGGGSRAGGGKGDTHHLLLAIVSRPLSTHSRRDGAHQEEARGGRRGRGGEGGNELGGEVPKEVTLHSKNMQTTVAVMRKNSDTFPVHSSE